MSIKHPQAIMAVDDGVFDLGIESGALNPRGITAVDAATFYENIQGHVSIRRRQELDDPSNYLAYRQPLPYNLMTQMTRDFKRGFFTFRRKPASGESELHGKVSVGVGGHVDGVYVMYAEDGSFDLPGTFALSALDELMDELDFYPRGSNTAVGRDEKMEILKAMMAHVLDQLNILLFDDNVSLRHFALVRANTVPPQYEVRISEKESDQLESLGVLTAEELLSTNTDGSPKYNLEGWSRICLEYFSAQATQKVKATNLEGPSVTEMDELDRREAALASLGGGKK